MGQREKRTIKKALIFLLVAAVICLFFIFALRWVLPFVIAFLIASAIDPSVRFITRRLHVKRGFACFVCIMAAIVVIGGITAAIVWRAVYELGELIRRMPELISVFSDEIGMLRDKLLGTFSAMPEQMRGFVYSQLENLTGSASKWAAELTQKLLGAMSKVASALPEYTLGVVTCVVGTFFISVRYEGIKAFIKRQIPDRYHAHASSLRSAAAVTFGKWLRAQTILVLITFCELAVAFCVLKVEYAIMLAMVIAVIDALPVLGTGIVLLPWAAISMLCGRFAFGTGLLITYAVIVVVRNCVEPKLVSAQLGLDPIVTLIAIYTGFKIAGVAGMILFPIGVLVIKQLNDGGYIKLWR
ncbi:MAG: sporulation integral membrane protein YtvI [Oscillospiraceae bacterium]|nr:sporulation integral membrane protein YtvI [Oscillospiraceae bacterium]